MGGAAPRRVTVVGGGGFIGTNLCRRLAADGVATRAFGRSRGFPDALEGIDWIQGTLSDRDAVSRAIDGADAVVHLVSTTTPASSNADMAADVAGNVLASIGLLEECVSAGVGKVVYLSSGGTVYGVPETVPIPEAAPTDPISSYGITRLAIEKYLGLFGRLHGLDSVTLRVANCYGPYQRLRGQQGVVAAFLERGLRGEPVELWGDGETVRDYVFVEDVVQAILLAIGHAGPEKVINVGSGEGRSLNDVVASLGDALGAPLEVVRREGRAVDVPRSVLDISLAERALGWTPETSWEEGLRRTVAWARKRQA
ncbi:NAD-dependent epimerase/dehydratase family protein [Microbaculum marinum]|uniref:NAD-dependent epimerase/dehydratase family protein n=1 Tax=Microbaculum marinum TaxID=1764581 RepID=A0AAW9RT15_9HYPH